MLWWIVNSGLYAVAEFVNSVVDFVNSAFGLFGAPALHSISLGQVSLVNSVVVDFVNSVVDCVNSAFVLVGAPL